MINREEAGTRGELNFFTPNQFPRGRTSSFGSEVEGKEEEESQKRHSELTQHQQHQHHQHEQQQQQHQQQQGHGQGQDEYELRQLVELVHM